MFGLDEEQGFKPVGVYDLQDLQKDSEKPAPLGVGWIASDIFMCMKGLNIYIY